MHRKQWIRIGLHWLSVAALLFLFQTVSLAQISNLRSKTLDTLRAEQALDSLSILPPLILVRDPDNQTVVPNALFKLENNRLLIDTNALKRQFPSTTKLVVQYRVLQFDLAAVQSRIDTSLIGRATRNQAIEFDYTPYNPPSPLIGGGLNSNGAYTRGLSFGNNQNLVFNSNLNLQLNGRLGSDVEIRAAISDNSLPLQPDGSTRQLQEFDRVYIQILRQQNSLIAGDFDLRKPDNSYFSNYFKRLQGGLAESTRIQENGDTLHVRGGAAISKGKFARQIIQGQEGNQGPYRLQGADGERFIIVLAGTEKVFIDGQLMQRGLADDYVIDYNLGELIFTARRLITKDSRITIEFEYAVQAYLRSTAVANSEWTHGKQRFFFNAYSEQDGINSAGAQGLSEAERLALNQAGDALSQAVASGIDSLESGFDPTRIQYKLVDTLVCGTLQRILVYSTHPDSARYIARFSEVPSGQGNYRLAQTSANGRVFEWISPDPVSCQPLGNYEPIIPLRAPELRQLFTVGAELQAGKKTAIKTEAALSNRDLNRFSDLGDQDNLGLASFTSLRHQLFSPKNARWEGALQGSYELTARDFRALNQYRQQEYLRDWNLSSNDQPAAEHIAQAGFLIKEKSLGQLDYALGLFNRNALYLGTRHSGSIQFQKSGFVFDGSIRYLESDGQSERTRFSRPKLDISYQFGKRDSLKGRTPWITLGVYGERERNQRSGIGSDSLLLSSFWYDLGRIYLKTPQADGRWQVGAYIGQRNDFFPTGPGFTQNTAAREFNINGKFQPTPGKVRQSIVWNLNQRSLHILQESLTPETEQNTYLGRIDYNLSVWKNALNLTTGYELGSGQSPRLEYNYLLVNPGEGQYTWVDRNQDSILQVDEMEIAVFQDQASYIRVAVTTTDYIRTNNAIYNQNIRLEPRLIWWQSKQKWKRFIARFTGQSTLQYNRKVFTGLDGLQAWNPLDFDIPDSLLVTGSASMRNALFFNRANPKWDVSLTQQLARNRLQVTTGFESRVTQSLTAHGRVNFSPQWSLESNIIQSEKQSETENFAARNFDIQSWELAPKLNYAPDRSLRLAGEYSHTNSKNSLPSGETARFHAGKIEINWTPASKPNAAGFRAATVLRLNGTYTDIRFDGQNNTALAYNMLNGLQNGKNYQWNIVLDRQLSQSLQLSLNYEGRKTGASNRLVHIGRAQVRALF
ncbi:MAG: hypothetical protein R2792_06395 [Saprospiraceae bacterium]